MCTHCVVLHSRWSLNTQSVEFWIQFRILHSMHSFTHNMYFVAKANLSEFLLETVPNSAKQPQITPPKPENFIFKSNLVFSFLPVDRLTYVPIVKFLLQYEWETYRAAICCGINLVMTTGPRPGVSPNRGSEGVNPSHPEYSGLCVGKIRPAASTSETMISINGIHMLPLSFLPRNTGS